MLHAFVPTDPLGVRLTCLVGGDVTELHYSRTVSCSVVLSRGLSRERTLHLARPDGDVA